MARSSTKTQSLGGKRTAIPIHWLGWHRPILHSTIDCLFERYHRDRFWDLDAVVCVLPSSMAGRRLTELLAEKAKRQSLILRPPEIITSGRLPELLYQAKFPFASDLEQILCWTKVLRKMPADILKPLLIEVPAVNVTAPWVELATLLSSLHRELSSDLTMFDDVAQMLSNDAANETEVERWKILAKVQRAYLDELHRAELWDIQTARQYAIEKKEPRTDRDIWVIGAVDLNRAQRSFLEAIHDRVTILIGAPESWRDGFDEFGTLRSHYWEDLPVELDANQLIARTTIHEAVDEVARQLAYLGSNFNAQEITLGVPDTSLVPVLTERLLRIGVAVRNGAGVGASQSSPVRLLRSIVAYLAEGTYEALAALVRLPAVFDFLTREAGLRSDFLQHLDLYYDKTLLRSVYVTEWPEATGRDVVLDLFEKVNRWLLSLRLLPTALRSWAAPIDEVLTTVYRAKVVDLDTSAGAALVDGCGAVSEAITQLSDLPETLMLDTTLKEAVDWIVREIDKKTIPPLRDPESIEMIGWLDLSLDDAPVLLLTGVHDGTVPESVNGDAFLPNKIRTRLGLMDNSRRYARDFYAMHVLMRSRPHLRIITSHLNVDGEPQTPSRLLLAVHPNELAKRVMQLTKPPKVSDLPTVGGHVRSRPIQSDLPIPAPVEEAGSRVLSMSPTDFKTYLDCPYRFYLSRILRLNAIDDRKMELEANDFGNLLHDTLAGLGDSPAATYTDATQLRMWLFAQLNDLANRRYGRQPPPVVIVQLEQARQRLAAFAVQQARRAAEGWMIWKTEAAIDVEDKVAITVPDQAPMPLIGRIDRIDYHPITKSYAIWDYKTSDNAVKPLAAHWSKSAGWKQLQLPLYREMAKALKIDGDISLGYINLPRATDKVEFIIGDFSDTLQAEALDAARDVIRCIRNNIFWPPSYDRIADWDIFRGICQHNVARRWDARWEASVEEALRKTADVDASAAENKWHRLPACGSEITGWKPMPPWETDSNIPLQDRPPDSIAVTLSTTSGTAPDEWFNRKLIKASAGTGKTFSLAIRMIRLLFADQSPEGILATTFTRKAAGEILERVLHLLAEAIEGHEGLEKLAEQLKPLKINRQGCIHQLSKLCSNLHRLRVNTLDGFYSQLARSFAIELKLPPGWTLADEFQTAKLTDLAITRIFENDDRSELRSLISQLNRGEAKRSIRREIHQTILQGYSLFQITKPEAWSNLEVPKEPDPASIEGAVAQIEGSRMKHKSFPAARDKLLDTFHQAAWESMCQMTLVVNATTTGKFYQEALPSELIEGVEVLKKLALSKELASRRAQSEAAYRLLSNFHAQFGAVKRAQRLVTFSDVSQRLADWFRARSAENADVATAADVDFRLDARIDHLLLDEFQDTSAAQWDILFPFAEAITNPAEGQATSFFCVGDVKQAIYGWRGGVSELFDVVKQQIKNIQEDSLDKSYRSSPVVIDFLNNCFSQLLQHENFGNCRDAAVLFADTFPLHETTKLELPGYVRIWNTAAKSKPSFVSDDSIDEGDELPEEAIQQCIRDVAELNQNAPHASIGILVRTNQELGPILHRLREAGVEASQEGGNPLDDSAAVELMLSLIQLADHPGDRVALFHLENTPLAIRLRSESSDATDSIDAEQLAVSVRTSLDDLGYGRTLACYAQMLSPHCSDRDQQRLDQLVQTAYRYDGMATLRGRDFISFVRENRVALSRPVAVRVMTIHQSKGLEFDAVFLPGLKKRFLSSPPTFVTWSSRPTEPPQGIMRYVNERLQSALSEEWQDAYRQQTMRAFSEALSTFYVSLTRARQALYLYAQPSEKAVQQWDSLLHSIFVASEERAKPDSIVYESGCREWYRRPYTDSPGVADSISPSIDGVQKPSSRLAIKLRPSTVDDFLRQRTTLKPSAASESRWMPLKNLFERNEAVGAIIGTLIHRWFEEIGWLEDFRWDRSVMRAIALKTLTPQEMPLIQLDDWMTSMEAYLESRCVAETLVRNRYRDWISASGEPLDLEITNERRLLEILDGSLLRGTIDRLVVGSENGQVVKAEILDYKTDAVQKHMPVDAWVRDRVEHHAPQLRLYRRVLGQQFQIDASKISMTLILLSGDHWVTF